MLIVGLTGGMATGKSVVADILREKGCYVDNADLLAQSLMEPGREAFQAVVNHFGQEILTQDGKIDRQKLGRIIFNAPEERATLNNLTHPLILNKVREKVASLEKSGDYEIYVTEAALIFEAGYQFFYDRVVLTFCQLEIQVERLLKRDGLSREEACLKIKSQWPLDKKIQLADYLIDTSGPLTETVEQTEELYLRLYHDAKLKKIGKLIREMD
jgi:dephospho-CoA kinase